MVNLFCTFQRLIINIPLLLSGDTANENNYTISKSVTNIFTLYKTLDDLCYKYD